MRRFLRFLRRLDWRTLISIVLILNAIWDATGWHVVAGVAGLWLIPLRHWPPRPKPPNYCYQATIKTAFGDTQIRAENLTDDKIARLDRWVREMQAEQP